jgi:hypothetical protein
MKGRNRVMRRLLPLLPCILLVFAAARLPAQPAAVSVSLVVPAPAPMVGPPAPPDASVPDEVIRAARGYLGVPYVTGGDSRSGLDCSGLVSAVFRETADLDLPRGVETLYRVGGAPPSLVHLGDLLFFDTVHEGTPRTPTHVGVYIGGDRFVHAASEGPKTGVIVSALTMPYYHDRFLGARRVIPWRAPVLPMKITDDYQSVSTASPFPSREAMRILVYNAMSGGGPVDLSVYHDGVEVLSRRVVPGAADPAEIALVPGVGAWMVKVNRIWKGRVLQDLSFRVEE